MSTSAIITLIIAIVALAIAVWAFIRGFYITKEQVAGLEDGIKTVVSKQGSVSVTGTAVAVGEKMTSTGSVTFPAPAPATSTVTK